MVSWHVHTTKHVLPGDLHVVPTPARQIEPGGTGRPVPRSIVPAGAGVGGLVGTFVTSHVPQNPAFPPSVVLHPIKIKLNAIAPTINRIKTLRVIRVFFLIADSPISDQIREFIFFDCELGNERWALAPLCTLRVNCQKLS
jgi:hypothetical protein